MDYELVDRHLLKLKDNTFEMSTIDKDELLKNGGYHDTYKNSFSKQILNYNKEEYSTWDIRRFLLRNAPDVPLYVNGKRVTGLRAIEDENKNIIGFDILLK